MRLSRSFAPKLTACLAVVAAWALLDLVVLTQVPAPAPPPQAPPAAPPAAPAGGGGGRGRAMSPTAQAAWAAMRAPLDRLTPVTDAMLRNPPPGDWLHWRRTYDGWAHSPLNQINRNTVKNLQVAWTFSVTSPNE